MKKLMYSIVAVLTLLTIGCNKTNLGVQDSVDQSRMSGVLPDPPELKKNFKIRVSQEFLLHGRTMAYNKFGKKIIDLRADEAESLMRGTAAKGGKGSGWGSGGIKGGGTTTDTTGGGGTVTPPSDQTPPRIIGVEPFNGTNYTIKNYWAGVTLFGYVDDETKLVRIQITIRGDVVYDQTTDLKSGYGNWNVIQVPYKFPYGDGTYDMTWKAWDSTGNMTSYNSVFSRNSNFTPLPSNFPTSYTLPYPKVEQYINQGGEGSCAAFTVNSGFSIQSYVRGGLTGGYNDNNWYSPEWIYNIGKGNFFGGCGAGSSVLGNMGIVVNRGVPTWSTLPYSSMNGCDTSIFTDAIRADAALHKGVWGTSCATADIDAIKYNITQGYVGMFSYQLDHQLINYPTADYVWNFPHFYDGGPHASCLIGFDDSKHAFLMLNSWGLSWANQGAIWVDYDFFWQAVTGGIYYFG